MIPPLDVFAISENEPVWLGPAETLVQALEIAQTIGNVAVLCADQQISRWPGIARSSTSAGFSRIGT